MRIQTIIFIGLLVTPLMSCTRSAKDDSAKVSIVLPATREGKVSATATASTLELAHVSINATGPGMATPVVYGWDSCHDCANPPSAPASFQLGVPSGSGRLIQVLAVYRDPATDQMIFYYGDSTADLNGTEITLDVGVFQVGQGNITSGRVSGRYFTSATEGPTGAIDIKYNPGNGKPALIVDQASIVNGWFNLFMLSGASLQYVLRQTGEMLWGQEMSLESPAMDPAENSGAYFDQRVRAYLPVHIRVSNNGGTTSYYPQESESYVWGYWGPGAVGKKVCTSGLDSSPVPTKLKRYVSGGYSSAPNLTVAHYINYNLAPPSKAVLIDTTSPYSTLVVQGGPSMSGTACGSFADTATNQYTNFMKVTLDLFDGNGGDSVSGFHGIFRNTGTYTFVNISGADPRVITGQTLPGVDTVFNALRLFKHVGPENMNIDTPNCLDILNQGFVPAASGDAVINSDGTFSIASNITAAEANSGVSAVICPLKNGTLAPLGVFLGKWLFGSYSGGGGGGSPATQLALLPPQKTVGTGTIANNVCTPVAIEGRTSGGTLGTIPMGTIVTLNTNEGATSVYQDSSCSGTALSSLPLNFSTTLVYLKRSSAGSTSANFSITANNALGSASATLAYMDVPSAFAPKVKIEPPTSISAFECHYLRFESWHDDGATSMIANFYDKYATNFTFNLPSTSGLTFYMGYGCQGTIASSVTLGTSVTAEISFMYTGSATSLNLQPVLITPSTPITLTDLLGAASVPVIQPGAVATVDLMMPPSVAEGMCQPARLRLTDSTGKTAPASVAMTFSLANTVGGTFYMTSSCNSPTTTANIAVGSAYQDLYFKSTTVGSGNFTVSSTSPAMSLSRSLQITPATFSQILIVMPGQTFTAGTGISGAANSVLTNTTTTATIYLVKYDNQVDTNANGVLLTSSFITNGSFVATPEALSFTNGTATLGVVPLSVGTPLSFSLSSGPVMGNTGPITTY